MFRPSKKLFTQVACLLQLRPYYMKSGQTMKYLEKLRVILFLQAQLTGTVEGFPDFRICIAFGGDQGIA